jgi:hypothetical protein
MNQWVCHAPKKRKQVNKVEKVLVLWQGLYFVDDWEQYAYTYLYVVVILLVFVCMQADHARRWYLVSLLAERVLAPFVWCHLVCKEKERFIVNNVQGWQQGCTSNLSRVVRGLVRGHDWLVPISWPNNFYRQTVGVPWFPVPHCGHIWGLGTSQICRLCCPSS